MTDTTNSLRPMWAEIRSELRDYREARAARKQLERELACYTSADDLNDLEAILERHDDAETEDIRRILVMRRAA